MNPPHETVSPLDSIWSRYVTAIAKGENKELQEGITLETLDLAGLKLNKNSTPLIDYKEIAADVLGKNRLLGGYFDGFHILTVRDICQTLSKIPDPQTTYVVGHQNPDADSIVSAIFEAVRRNYVYPDKSCIPWVEKIPMYVQKMLGAEFTRLLLEIPKPLYHNDIILVDCHTFNFGEQSQVKGIIEHHMVTTNLPRHITVTQDRSWSTTIQIYIKLLGSGLDLDPPTARLMTAASICQAEPGLLTRCPGSDRIALNRMRWLGKKLLNDYWSILKLIMGDENKAIAFHRDYRQTSFGFVVIHCLKYSNFTFMARRNNEIHHLPLTVVKEVRVSMSPPYTSSERITLVFNEKFYNKGFRIGAAITIKAACQEFHGKVFPLKRYELNLEGISTQTPRPLLTPLLEKLVQEQLRFFYSKSIGRYISAGFYSGSSATYGIAKTLRAPLTLENVKTLLKGQTNTSFLNIQQYREVCEELEELGDTYFLSMLKEKEAVSTFRPTYADICDMDFSLDFDYDNNTVDVVVNPRLFSIFEEVTTIA